MGWNDRLRFLYMADGASSDGMPVPEFEEQNDDDEFEIIEVGPGDQVPERRVEEVEEEVDPDDGLPDDVRKLSRKELFEQLQQVQEKSDSVEAMRQGIAQLGETLQQQPRNQQQQVPQQQPGESLSEFKERFNKEYWKSKDPFDLLQRAVTQMVGPAVQQLSRGTASANKRALMNDPDDGPVFKKYRKEVENLVAGLPANQQANPQVWDYALGQVKQLHADDIMEDRIEQEVQRRLNGEQGARRPSRPKAGESSRGGGEAAGARPAFDESSSSSRRSPKKRVYLTEEDKQLMKAKGISREDYIRVRYGG